jgi:BirA family biotin operon repressor/biotin-[acetyl-CoA-carboxylase] ligase
MILDEQTRRRLAATTRFGDIRELPEVDSTNRYLRDLARAGAADGLVVVADHQSAGRGRLGRTWEAPPGGALLVSILFRPAGPGWLVPAAVALAAADACGPEVSIKWPNDLLVGDRKLAGVLAEADAGAVVVGIGINVAWAPGGAAALGPSCDRGRLLATLLENLEQRCDRWDDVAAAYRGRCATVGREVRVEIPGGAVLGRAEAVEPDGRLRVVTANGIRTFSAADVVHVRPATRITDP